MTREEKQLLLKDICARLPYENTEVKVTEPTNDIMGEVFVGRHICSTIDIEDFILGKFIIRPYLRPMSSMTNEEKKDILQSLNIYGDIDNEGNLLLGTECNIITLKTCKKYLGELNKRMFDVCHLIEKGLALEAQEGMYETK